MLGTLVQASPHQLEQYYPWKHHDQLESKRLGLTFQVSRISEVETLFYSITI